MNEMDIVEDNNSQNNEKQTKLIEKTIPKCGIVMPISSIDNCTAEHWAEVLNI